eukprot:5131296-Alexandrium_andersonii.AAC.1
MSGRFRQHPAAPDSARERPRGAPKRLVRMRAVSELRSGASGTPLSPCSPRASRPASPSVAQRS